MTLVVAGYMFNGEPSAPFLPIAKETPYQLRGGQKNTGLFFAADSTISTGGMTLLSGFRKIYCVPIKLWEPYFVGESFQGYKSTLIEMECVLAFSGNTLTAQHLINSVSGHLSGLQISYVDKYRIEPIRYTVLEKCQKSVNPLYGKAQYSEDTFLRDDYAGVLTAERIKQSIEHSLASALSSAKKYKLDERSFASLFTGFLAGIRCPTTGQYSLYEFTMDTFTDDEGLLQPKFDVQRVKEGELAVLGMKREFEHTAQTKLQKVGPNSSEVAEQMFDFLNLAVDQVLATGRKDIDRPTVLKLFNTDGLKVVRRRET